MLLLRCCHRQAPPRTHLLLSPTPWRRHARAAASVSVRAAVDGGQALAEAAGVLALVVTVHECGHFAAAYLQNIRVAEFSIGFGPTLGRFRLPRRRSSSSSDNAVECSLRAVPLGGYIGFPDSPEDDPRILRNRPPQERLLVAVAGVAANVAFAFAVLAAQSLTVGVAHRDAAPGVVVPQVFAASAAARDGLRAGDVVLAVDGRALLADAAAVPDLVDRIRRSPGRAMDILVHRGGPSSSSSSSDVTVTVTPDSGADGAGRIGVQLAPNARVVVERAGGLADAAVMAGGEFRRLSGSVVQDLRSLVLDFSATAAKVSGPVAIVAVGAQVAEAGADGLFQFAAVLNLNLAVVNMLPLPALDGCHVALILLEWVRGGKKLPVELEKSIMSSGLAVVLALGVFLMVRDAITLNFDLL